LANLNPSCVHGNFSVFTNVKPGVNVLGKGFAAPLPSSARFLRDQGRFKNRHYYEARAQKLEEIPPVQFKPIRCRRPQFIALRLNRNICSKFPAHRLAPFATAEALPALAAFSIALTIRG